VRGFWHGRRSRIECNLQNVRRAQEGELEQAPCSIRILRDRLSGSAVEALEGVAIVVFVGSCDVDRGAFLM
jgi:hypothetical protein